MDIRFLLGGIYVLETFLTNSDIFLNLGFGAKLKEMPSEIIIPAMEIVRLVSSEEINSLELPSIRILTCGRRHDREFNDVNLRKISTSKK